MCMNCLKRPTNSSFSGWHVLRWLTEAFVLVRVHKCMVKDVFVWNYKRRYRKKTALNGTIICLCRWYSRGLLTNIQTCKITTPVSALVHLFSRQSSKAELLVKINTQRSLFRSSFVYISAHAWNSWFCFGTVLCWLFAVEDWSTRSS